MGIQPTTQALQPTALAPQLTAEAVSCLYVVGCLYESLIHVHTDRFSCRGGNTANDASTSDQRNHTDRFSRRGGNTKLATQVPAPTAEAPQLTAEAISCLYGVGCLYESPTTRAHRLL